MISYASSLDQIGALGRTTEDCATLLNAICGHDRWDSTSAHIRKRDFKKSLNKGIKGLKIGLPREYFVEGIDVRVEDQILKAVKLLGKNGADIIDISLPHTQYAISSYYLIATAEASSNLARYDGVKYGFRSNKDLPDSVRM